MTLYILLALSLVSGAGLAGIIGFHVVRARRGAEALPPDDGQPLIPDEYLRRLVEVVYRGWAYTEREGRRLARLAAHRGAAFAKNHSVGRRAQSFLDSVNGKRPIERKRESNSALLNAMHERKRTVREAAVEETKKKPRTRRKTTKTTQPKSETPEASDE